MYIALAVTIAAIISLAIGFSVEQAYGQANMTENNVTAENVNMTAGNDTKGSVSGGLAVSDEGASGKKK
jgi:negative regulator of sigma E activity